MNVKRIIWLFALTASLASLAMAAGAQYNGGNSSTTRRPNGFLEAEVATDRTQYQNGRAVQITMTLTNLGQNNWIRQNGSNKEYTFAVRDSRTNRVVYDLARHKRLPANRFTLGSGETQTYKELWDKRDDSGQSVRPGVYVIEATLWPQQMISTQIYLSDRSGGGGNGGNGGGGWDGDNGPRPRPDDPGNGPNVPDNNGDIRGRVTFSPRRVSPGDTVNFTYTIRNTGNRAVLYRFNSGKQHEIVVRDRRNRQIWSSSDGMFFTQSFSTITLTPGQEKTFNATWRLPDNFREGSYIVAANLTTNRVGNRDSDAEVPATASLSVGRGDYHGNNGGNHGGDSGDYGDGHQGGGYPSGDGDSDSNGDSGGNGGNWSGGNGSDGGGNWGGSNGGSGSPFFVSSLRELTGSRAENYIGRRITVNAMYNGSQGGSGQPPVSRNSWVILDAGVPVYVVGSAPNVPIGRKITVTGTARRSNEGRVYIQSN